MKKLKYYAGIGSRITPPNIGHKMTLIANLLHKKGYVLRSGGAVGADRFFEIGCENLKEIFYANDCEEWCLEEVKKHLPNDRSGFDNWKEYTKQLLGRNMKQILGEDGKNPIDFLVCWTPCKDYATSKVGGTGYAIRCALHYNIPVYNLVDPNDTSSFYKEILDIDLKR